MSEKLTLEELTKTREFQQLTEKQRLFVATYVESGINDNKYDAVGAAMTAYGAKNRNVARIMSYSLLQNIRIIQVLNLHFNTTPTEAFLTQIERAIHNKRLTPQQVSAMWLKCQVLGLGQSLKKNKKIREAIEKDSKDDKPARKRKGPPPEDPPTKEPQYWVKK